MLPVLDSPVFSPALFPIAGDQDGMCYGATATLVVPEHTSSVELYIHTQPNSEPLVTILCACRILAISL